MLAIVFRFCVLPSRYFSGTAPLPAPGPQAVYQFIISFPLLVPSGLASDVAPSDLGANLWAGMRCYVGFNTSDSDNCGLAPLFANLYILFNLAYNVLIVAMLKYGSSNILWLCLTIQVPGAYGSDGRAVHAVISTLPAYPRGLHCARESPTRPPPPSNTRSR